MEKGIVWVSNMWNKSSFPAAQSRQAEFSEPQWRSQGLWKGQAEGNGWTLSHVRSQHSFSSGQCTMPGTSVCQRNPWAILRHFRMIKAVVFQLENDAEGLELIKGVCLFEKDRTNGQEILVIWKAQFSCSGFIHYFPLLCFSWNSFILGRSVCGMDMSWSAADHRAVSSSTHVASCLLSSSLPHHQALYLL